ncbi:hypothetical protein ACHQM5_004904 [Ranunculus cassubicifolius]
MKRILLHSIRYYQNSSQTLTPISKFPFTLTQFTPKFFSSHNQLSNPNPNPNRNPNSSSSIEIEDVSTKDLKDMIKKYYEADDDEMVPDLLEAILRRKMLKKHEESDDEILQELQEKKKIVDHVSDKDFDEGLAEAIEGTDDTDKY